MKAWLAVLALVAAPAWSDPNGILLVAKPGLADPNFSETVIVVARAEDGSTVGVVLNRPLDADRYSGGPVMREVLVALFHADEPPADAAFQVLPSVYLTMHPRNIERLRDRPAARVRLFSGFAGWAPRQLEAEIDQGAWYALRASESLLFRKNTSGLWRELVGQAGGARAGRELYWVHEFRVTPARRRRAPRRFRAALRTGRGDDPRRASRLPRSRVSTDGADRGARA
jgi:putative transcriptional regulator